MMATILIHGGMVHRITHTDMITDAGSRDSWRIPIWGVLGLILGANLGVFGGPVGSGGIRRGSILGVSGSFWLSPTRARAYNDSAKMSFY